MNTPLWFSNLLFWSAQIILLVLMAGFLPRLFQIRQPRVLLLYWRTLLAISLLLPFVQPWHRAKPISLIAASTTFEIVPPPSASNPAVAHWHLPSLDLIAQILGAVILAGIAVRFVMLALGLLKLRQFRQASSPIPSSTAESVAVLEEMRVRANASAEFRLSADVDSPVTFGFLAPVILLPERFPSMDARFQSAIACHELLHVRRRDWAHHLAEEIARAVFWFHPAIAWLIARVRLAREQVVDLEVVKLTNARKPYLEALLAFTNARASISAVPAPPFLAERQLAERVALMLKEVRMSRTRLVVSLTSIVCFLALTVTLAVWAFPLKAVSRNAQNAPQSGVAGGVSGGVTGGVSQSISGGVSGGVSSGVAGGVSGGISSRISGSASRDIPTVDLSTVWTDTVKRGPMVRQVRGLGTIVRAEDSGNLIARISLPEFLTKDVRANQNAAVSTRTGTVKGYVLRVSPTASADTRSVDVALDASRAIGFSAGLQIDATIDIEKLDDILSVGRPVHAGEGAKGNSTFSLFKISNDGTEAERVNVKFGRSSVNTIEILDGLKEGDKIILSDMSSYDNANRIHITDEKPVSKP
jgi:beta-lactamase regulating signal transducer with metallopeptidase domain